MTIPATDRPPPPPRPRLLGWPVRHPLLTLTVAAILAVAAALSAARIRPSASLRAMVGDSSPSAAALENVLDSFRGVDDLFVLITAEGGDEGDAPADPARAAAPLVAFASDLEGAIRADPETSALCTRIGTGVEPQAMEFFQSEVVPAGLWYLDDESLEQVRQRLTLPQMREQLRRDEAMIATPGPAAAALSKALLRDPLRLREFVGDQVRARLAGGPALGGAQFISGDGRAMLMRISGARPASDLDFCALISSRVGAITDRLRPPGLKVQFAGAYAIAARAASSIRRDMISNSIWSVVMMQGLFLLSYRRLGAFALTFLPVGLAILLAFGAYSLVTTQLTPLAAVTGAVLAGLGIDYCIHYQSHFQAALDQARPDPLPAPAAADKTIREIGMPLLAAGLTTVHGFVAIAFAGVRALRGFALLGALGLALAMVAAVTVLPAMLGLAVGRARGVGGVGGARFGTGRLFRSITRQARLCAVVAAAGLVGLLLVAGIPRMGRGHPLALDADLTVMHPRPSPPLDAQREISRRFSGLADSLLVLIEADTPEALARRAHGAQRALSGSRGRTIGFAGAFGLASLIPDPADAATRLDRLAAFDADRIVADFEAAVRESPFNPAAFHPYAEFLRTLASRREPPSARTVLRYPVLAGAVLGARGSGLGSGGSGLDPESRDPGPEPRSSLMVLFFDRNLDDRVQRDEVIAGTRSVLAAVPGATLTGVGVVGSDLETLIHHTLPRVLMISGAAVVLTILVSFRRIIDVALILIPAAWGVVAVLAWMAVGGERLNMANMIAFPLLLGICVDYGIFMVGLARTCRRAGQGTAALTERLAANGHAVLMTSGTTIIGFGTLVTCSTPAIQSLGRLVAIGVTGCVVGTFFLLAPLLHLMHRPK